LPALPGPGTRPGSGGRPDFGNRVDSIRDRLQGQPVQLPSTPHNRWVDRANRWQDWHHRHFFNHGWHNGHWQLGWRPGYRWDYWWDNYPVLTAFGVTTWAVNRVSWAFGYNNYQNPYATPVVIDNSVYNYAQPLVMTPDETSLATAPDGTASPPLGSEQALTAFDQARQSFFAGDYEAALASTDAALREMPNDAVIHEFRALALFAVGRYQEAAATLYAVLSVGPGWDWTTMSSLYPSRAEYTRQLRALEDTCAKTANDPALRFVLAYHYLTTGHEEAAAGQLQKLLAASPQDRLAAQILMQLDPEAKIPDPPKQVQPPKPTTTIASQNLVGTWVAQREDGSSFTMTLGDDGAFAWTYSKDGQSQKVDGVWAVDQDGVLALEMNDEGVMLAQTILSGTTLDFYMLGDTEGAEPLRFAKR
jgi:tetratricopeptide (TPR) repeat protein